MLPYCPAASLLPNDYVLPLQTHERAAAFIGYNEHEPAGKLFFRIVLWLLLPVLHCSAADVWAHTFQILADALHLACLAVVLVQSMKSC